MKNKGEGVIYAPSAKQGIGPRKRYGDLLPNNFQ